MFDLIEIVPTTDPTDHKEGIFHQIVVEPDGSVHESGKCPPVVHGYVRERAEHLREVNNSLIGYTLLFLVLEVGDGFHMARSFSFNRDHPKSRSVAPTSTALLWPDRFPATSHSTFSWFYGPGCGPREIHEKFVGNANECITTKVWTDEEEAQEWRRRHEPTSLFTPFGRSSLDYPTLNHRVYTPRMFDDLKHQCNFHLNDGAFASVGISAVFQWLMLPISGMRSCRVNGDGSLIFSDKNGEIYEPRQYDFRELVPECMIYGNNTADITYYVTNDGEYRVFPEFYSQGRRSRKTPNKFFEIFGEIGDVVETVEYNKGDQITMNPHPDADFILRWLR